MTTQPEALRLADRLDAGWSAHGLDCVSGADLIRRQHSCIEADEALLRQAMETLESMADHAGMTMSEADAITALRTRLEQAK